jgi:Mg2+/Co2+ transporter CorB
MIEQLVKFLIKNFNIDVTRVAPVDQMDVIEAAIENNTSDDSGINEQRAMLRSVFALQKVTVEEVMTYRNNIHMIDADLSTEMVITQLLDSPYSRVPIWADDADNVIGVLSTKALMRELHAKRGRYDDVNVKDIAFDPWFIPNTTSLFDQLQAFRQRHAHFALVVDEYGTLMGIVTMEDILEEIVGEISDENDNIVEGVRQQGNGTYVIDGTTTIRELNRELGWNLPANEDYTTIAGLVLYESHILPHVGQSYVFHGYRFDVVRKRRHQLSVIRVTPPDVLQASMSS